MTRPKLRATPIVLAIALVLATAHARAQTTAGSALPGAPIQISIAAQPLAEALNDWARQTRVQLIVQQALVAGRAAPAVSGSLTPQQAVDRLLVGSGLVAVAEGGAVVVRAAPAAASESVLPAVTVTATSELLPGELPKPFAGGQVARGGRVGLLGNKDFLETPFSTTSVTRQALDDQQARSIQDVLVSDPTVTYGAGRFQGVGQVNVRGFLNDRPYQFDGLYGLSGIEGDPGLIGVERVEVLRGPSALLSGIAPSGFSLGGVVNFVPKRAGELPLNRLTLGYMNDSTYYSQIDIGRRFGVDNAVGLRVNGQYLDGNTPVNGQTQRQPALTAALDYRSDTLRASLDIGQQKSDLNPQHRSPTVAAGFQVPAAPDLRLAQAAPFGFLNTKDKFFLGRFDVNISPLMNVYAAYGQSRGEADRLLTNPTITAANGDTTIRIFDVPARSKSSTGEIGVRGSFTAGGTKHQWVATANQLDSETFSNFVVYGSAPSNLYVPSTIPAPTRVPLSTLKDGSRKLTSYALADTLSWMDDRLQVTLGVRQQNIEIKSFDELTGALSGQPYDRSAITPSVGVVFKTSPNTSVYANYIEGLSPGPTAPATALNANEVFPPTISKQIEIGAKADFDGLGIQTALFEIKRESAGLNVSSNVFGLIGEQRNRGLEILLFGEPVKGVRTQGGLVLINGKFTKSANASLVGKDAPAATPRRAILGVEWDPVLLPGLTLSSRLTYTSSQVVDAANTQSIPSWTKLDLGAKYRISGFGGKPVDLRFSVENAAGKNYFASTDGFSQLILGTPRTFLVSATMDF